ncbi:11069_t:CDS:2, partial [Funneliformis mosseae]
MRANETRDFNQVTIHNTEYHRFRPQLFEIINPLLEFINIRRIEGKFLTDIIEPLNLITPDKVIDIYRFHARNNFNMNLPLSLTADEQSNLFPSINGKPIYETYPETTDPKNLQLNEINSSVTLLLRNPTTLGKFDKLNRSIEVTKEFLRYQKRDLSSPIKSHEFSKYYQRNFHRLSPMRTIILFTYGLGTYEELMKDYYNFDETIRPNLLIGLNSHHVYKRATFGTQFKLIHSGFGEIDLG